MLERLGEYAIKDKLGEGGMGAVYRGFQESLQRDVALKVLTERLCKNEKFIARFKREARSAASIVHPNVIQIYSIGEEDNVHYFAMEFVRGHDLTQLMAEGKRFSVEEAIDIVAQVGEAIHCASDVGIIHRDIKPANIMLTDRGLVKVTDFGLAKSTSSDLDVTEAGTIVGTANYMSPEQGQGKPLDVRSDIYSLGVVFYELLAGRLPFIADQPSAVLYMHIYEEACPPSRYNPAVTPAVDRMVLRMMAKDPDGRPRDATALLNELRGLRQSLGVAPPRAHLPQTARIDAPLPASADSEADTGTLSAPQASPATGLHALVADDVPSVRRLYCKVLSDMGFEVNEASDGEEAIAVWKEQEPNLVLLDLNMPKLGGMEALSQVREAGLGGAVIVISAKKERKTVVQAAHHGVSAYLTKPVNINELRQRVSRVMRLPQQGSAKAKTPAASVAADPPPPPAADPRHVVICDPTAYSRNLFRGALEAMGHEAACVTSVEQVRSIVEEDRPDALVIAAGAENPRAAAFLEALKASGREVPAVTVVDEGDEAMRSRLDGLGLGPVLVKPVRLEHFRDAVTRLFARPANPPSQPMQSAVYTSALAEQAASDAALTVFDFARKLGATLPEQARADFERRMQEGSGLEVRNAIRNLLRRMRADGQAEEAMRYVRHAYLHGDIETRNLCLNLLPDLLGRKEEIEVLLKVITDEDYRIRCRVLQRLGELRAEEGLDIVVRFLNDDVFRVRKEAASCLACFDMAKVIEPLLVFYAHAEEPLPEKIRGMLLRNTHAKEILALEKLALRGDIPTREYLARFMGDLRTKLSVRLLETLLEDAAPRVRAAAARSAGLVGNQKLQDALQKTLTDANSEVQAAAVQGLQRYPLTPGAKVYLDALARRGKRIRPAAVRFLTRLNRNADELGKMLENLGREPEEQRRYLSLLLGRVIPDNRTLNEVVRLLNAPDAGSRKAAARQVVSAVQETLRTLANRGGGRN